MRRLFLTPVKNSIRHNLSLHTRFIRVQNEGTGKSSWWMLNPEGGKTGKTPRRRAVSMDNGAKFLRIKGKASKKKQLQAPERSPDASPPGAPAPGPMPAAAKWATSPASHASDDYEAWADFRGGGGGRPLLAEAAELEDDEALEALAPSSPLMYPSPASALSPALGARCPGELPRLAELGGPLGLPEALLDASQDTYGPRARAATPAYFGGCKGGAYGGGAGGGFGPPALGALRRLPMQTIQENKQASFAPAAAPFRPRGAGAGGRGLPRQGGGRVRARGALAQCLSPPHQPSDAARRGGRAGPGAAGPRGRLRGPPRRPPAGRAARAVRGRRRRAAGRRARPLPGRPGPRHVQREPRVRRRVHHPQRLHGQRRNGLQLRLGPAAAAARPGRGPAPQPELGAGLRARPGCPVPSPRGCCLPILTPGPAPTPEPWGHPGAAPAQLRQPALRGSWALEKWRRGGWGAPPVLPRPPPRPAPPRPAPRPAPPPPKGRRLGVEAGFRAGKSGEE